MAKKRKSAPKKLKRAPAKNSTCGTGSRSVVKEKITKKLGYKPKHLYAVKVAGKPGFCTSVRNIPK